MPSRWPRPAAPPRSSRSTACPERLELATAFGADSVIDITEAPLTRSGQDRAQAHRRPGRRRRGRGGRSSRRRSTRACKLLGQFGRYVEIGNINIGKTFEFDPSRFVFANKTMVGVSLYDPAVLSRALDFLGRASAHAALRSARGSLLFTRRHQRGLRRRRGQARRPRQHRARDPSRRRPPMSNDHDYHAHRTVHRRRMGDPRTASRHDRGDRPGHGAGDRHAYPPVPKPTSTPRSAAARRAFDPLISVAERRERLDAVITAMEKRLPDIAETITARNGCAGPDRADACRRRCPLAVARGFADALAHVRVRGAHRQFAGGARAVRCGRGHHAVELPAVPGGRQGPARPSPPVAPSCSNRATRPHCRCSSSSTRSPTPVCPRVW